MLQRSGLSRTSFRRKLVTAGTGNPPLTRAPRGEAFEYVRRRFAPPFFLRVCYGRGRFPPPLRKQARVEDPSRRANRRFANPGGEAFEYARSRFAPPFFFGCATRGGRSLRVHPRSFFASLPGEQNRIYSSGILWMYFNFMYGILFLGVSI
jgi:hypothetical protein